MARGRLRRAWWHGKRPKAKKRGLRRKTLAAEKFMGRRCLEKIVVMRAIIFCLKNGYHGSLGEKES